jgi:hypothetical protein
VVGSGKALLRETNGRKRKGRSRSGQVFFSVGRLKSEMGLSSSPVRDAQPMRRTGEGSATIDQHGRINDDVQAGK